MENYNAITNLSLTYFLISVDVNLYEILLGYYCIFLLELLCYVFEIYRKVWMLIVC